MSVVLNQGVNLNTITTASRNAGVSTATGTIIYNSTTASLQLFNGTTWQNIKSPISGPLNIRKKTIKEFIIIGHILIVDYYIWTMMRKCINPQFLLVPGITP